MKTLCLYALAVLALSCSPAALDIEINEPEDKTEQQKEKKEDTNGDAGKTYKVRISFKGKSLTATFDDNATSRALVEMMPMTLPMMDLYGDEMCYRFTGHPLPTDNVQYYLHKKGEFFYWPPGPSFVIRYIETDEYLSIQHIGQIDSGVEQMAGIGDTDVKFELITD